MTNCKNCGAPLVDCVCEYCGTYYPELQTMVVVAGESIDDIELGDLTLGEIREIPSGATISEAKTMAKAWCSLAVASSTSFADFTYAANRVFFSDGHVGIVCSPHGEPDRPIGKRTLKRLATGLRRAIHG